MKSNWELGILLNLVFVGLSVLAFIFIIAHKKEDAEWSKDLVPPGAGMAGFLFALALIFGLLPSIATWEHSIPKYIRHKMHLAYLETEKGQHELYLTQKQKEIKAIAKVEDLTGNGTENELKIRIRDMYNLDQNIQAKKIKVLESLGGFKFDIRDLEKRIKDSRLSFTESLRDQTVGGQLRLLQRKKAYSEQLIVIDKQLVAGINELTIKMDEAYTDLQMIETLGQTEVERLLVEIDKVLKQYQPYADDKIIDQSRLRFKSLETLWQEIVN